MSTRMRAKFLVEKVDKYESGQSLQMRPVCADQYGANGENEDNDFARWTPGGSLQMTITNPDLFDQFNVGDKYYLDFTKVEEVAPKAEYETHAPGGCPM